MKITRMSAWLVVVALSLLIGTVVSSYFAVRASARELAVETNRANDKAELKRKQRERADKKAELERKQRERAEAKEQEARQGLYAVQMTLAQHHWESSEVGLLLDSLKKTQPQPGEPDLRGFEWHYWNRLAHSYQLNLQGHTHKVYSVALSADGQRLASASYDKMVKVWDATSGQEMFTLKGHTSDVRSVAFSPDGQRLASASHDKMVKVWDARTLTHEPK